MISLAEMQADLAALRAVKMRLLTGRLTTTIETSTPVGRSSKTSQAVKVEDLTREIAMLEAKIATLTGSPGGFPTTAGAVTCSPS